MTGPLGILLVGRLLDGLDGLAATLAAAGHRAVLALEIKEWEQDEAVPAPGGVQVVTGVDLYRLATDSAEVDGLVESTGPFDGVVLGYWTELVGVDDDPLDAFAWHGLEIIAIEAPNEWAEDVTRSTTRWSAATGNRASVFLAPEHPRAGPDHREAADWYGGPVADAVRRAGWVGPVTLRAVNRMAAARRRSGADPLAGRLWRLAEGFDSARPWLLAADAADVARLRGNLSARDLRGLDEPGPLLDRFGLRAVVAHPDSGIAFVEVTPHGGAPDAIRVSTLHGAFTEPCPFEPIGSLEVPSAALVIGDPWDIFDGDGGVEVAAGAPAVFDAETLAGSGLRLRRRQPAALVDAVEVRRTGVPSFTVRLERGGAAFWHGRAGAEPSGARSARLAPAAFAGLAAHLADTGCVDWVEPPPRPAPESSVELAVERLGHRHEVVSSTGLLDGIVWRVGQVVAPLGWRSTR